MLLDHSGYQKTLLVKSDMHVLGQEANQVPKGCPMGPKILVPWDTIGVPDGPPGSGRAYLI